MLLQPRKIAVALIALTALSGTSLVSAGSYDGRQPSAPNPGTRSEAPASAPDHRLPERGAVERAVQHDDPTIQRALTVLGQAINPIALVSADEARAIYARTPGAGAPSAAMNAFRAPGDMNDPNIYVNRASAVFRTAARKPTALALLKLAATLVHEQIHNTDGDHAAYRLQSDFVRGKLDTLSARERQEARAYLQTLDARAARAQIDWLKKAHRRGQGHAWSGQGKMQAAETSARGPTRERDCRRRPKHVPRAEVLPRTRLWSGCHQTSWLQQAKCLAETRQASGNTGSSASRRGTQDPWIFATRSPSPMPRRHPPRGATAPIGAG